MSLFHNIHITWFNELFKEKVCDGFVWGSGENKINSIGEIKAALGQIKLIPRKGRRGKVKTFFSSLSKKRFPADSILSWTDPFSWVIFLSFLVRNLSICSINCWSNLIPKIDQNMDINIIIVQFWSMPHVSKYNCVLCEQMLLNMAPLMYLILIWQYWYKRANIH